MAELTYLGSLGWEKWLYMPVLTAFRPVLFVTKCHTEDSSQISHSAVCFFDIIFSVVNLKLVTTCEDRNKDQFKN